ncbi:hypothetical protein [Chitinophaga eiseniae]|uniref:hypothetical protein n=1 Tax=Chitinophaga eiseniae TaxID=634771 RepID=UPI00099A160D|nr:hypothetical protein [Chitinophaga eiseniae]
MLTLHRQPWKKIPSPITSRSSSDILRAYLLHWPPAEFPGDWPYEQLDASFEYIGSIDGYGFQHTTPEDIHLFYSPALKKAVITFGNT